MSRAATTPRFDAGSAAASAAGEWPTLDADLEPGSDAGEAVRKRICIATPDIVGPVRNGGIGTVYHHLARMLAEWGHEVVVAYVNGNAGDAERMAEARTLYAGFGVTFEPIVPRPAAETVLAQAPAPTWTLLDWLRARAQPFDAVHVSDWRGLGYGPLLAKSLGLAFPATHFVVHGHSPTLWSVEGNRQLVSTEEELAWVFLERRSVELADTVICGSAHLLEWMSDAGYALPKRAFVWPNPFPEPDPGPEAAAARSARGGAPLDEMVFFGRLEPRKGLALFVDAVDLLVRRGRAPAQITFLGAAARRFDGPGLIDRAARDWPITIDVITECGAPEAVDYLSRPGRLAVLPSLLENASMAVTECLAAGIPFVAAATGGTPELVAPEDRGRVLVPPDPVALADRLAELAGTPLRAARPRWAFDSASDGWRRWYGQTGPFAAAAERFAARTRAVAVKAPPVTICLAHRDRPEALRLSADSVLDQDYPVDFLEAVLVDDGSESDAARAAVTDVEAAFTARGWRVVRQERRGPGTARNAAAAAARGKWLLFLHAGDVLFPDAVSRWVRAARFAGADCVPAPAIRLANSGDLPAAAVTRHDPHVRFVGAARAWNRVRPVAGGARMLVTRDAFTAGGGFTETPRDTYDDPAFLDRLIRADRRVEPLPDPVCCGSIGGDPNPGRPHDAARAEPSLSTAAPDTGGQPDEERAYAAYAAACIAARRNAPAPASRTKPCTGPEMALALRRTSFGVGKLEVEVLIPSEWFERIGPGGDSEAAFELRRNGRIVAVAAARAPRDVGGGVLRFPARWRGPGLRDTCYSLHDAATGEAVAAVAAPAFRRARRVKGAVESRPRAEVRGWAFDPARPERIRRVAIHVDGRLRVVLAAASCRGDVARWKGTGGRHGFLWRVPDAAATDGARIDVFDADTGRPLRGSPLRIRGGRAEAHGASPVH